MKVIQVLWYETVYVCKYIQSGSGAAIIFNKWIGSLFEKSYLLLMLLFIVHLTTLLLAQIVQRRMIGWLMNKVL
jgi:hypothetical protein